MKHPNPEIQKNQEKFLEECPEDQKIFHERLFRIGNTTIAYHQHALNVSNKTQEIYFKEWLEGLPSHISADMREKGLQKCKTMLPFTRYVNERNDIGMEEFMKEHLSEEDFNYYKEMGK